MCKDKHFMWNKHKNECGTFHVFIFFCSLLKQPVATSAIRPDAGKNEAKQKKRRKPNDFLLSNPW